MSYYNENSEGFTLVELNYEYGDDGTTTQWQTFMESAISRADTVRFSAPVYRVITSSHSNVPDRPQIIADTLSAKLNAPPGDKPLENSSQIIRINSSEPAWKERSWVPPESLCSSLKESFRGEDSTRYFVFHLTFEVQTFLRACSALDLWGPANNLPEDPAFYSNDQVILWTISHENMVYLAPTE